MDFRYLIFQYDVYYPSGGMNDLIGTFNDIEDVRSFIENNKSNYDNYHIYDRISGEQIHDLWSDELPQPTVIKSVCVSCDEQKETHELCMDCVKKMIKENQQTDL
jgi:ribosomal protein L32